MANDWLSRLARICLPIGGEQRGGQCQGKAENVHTLQRRDGLCYHSHHKLIICFVLPNFLSINNTEGSHLFRVSSLPASCV